MVEKGIKRVRIIYGITIIILIIVLAMLLTKQEWVESVIVFVGSIVVTLKFAVSMYVIGYQKNNNVELQKNVTTYKMKIDELEVQINESVKQQNIYRAELVKINKVENQHIYPKQLTSDDQLMKDVRNNLDEVEVDLRLNGLLNSFFNTVIFDNLCVFIETLDSSKYRFVDTNLNKIFVPMKKDLKEFNLLYNKNVMRSQKTIMAQLQYTYMIQWKWKFEYTKQEFNEAEKDMNRINELLRKIILSLDELVDLYLKKQSPLSE